MSPTLEDRPGESMFAGAINLFLGVGAMKEHIGVQYELRQGVPILVNDVLTELLQQAANFLDVIGIGFEFGLLALRQCFTSQGARKERNECYARYLFVHLTFSFAKITSR